MALTLGLALAWVRPAHADCAPASPGPSHDSLPRPWQSAVDRLVRSAAEPGHPWSCSGGRIDLELTSSGAVLRVAREGETPITRAVSEPSDVVPLGQALLAAPLEPTPSPVEHDDATTSAAPVLAPAPIVAGAQQPRERDDAATRPKEPRILLGGGIDGRAAGSSSGAWLGPTLSAAVPLGRWLPSISLRQQSGISDGPPLDEFSFGLAVQYRIPLRPLELRAGLGLRGAVVLRDLPRPQGAQSQLQGRAGPILSLVIPVVRWGNVVISADADFLGLSRRTAEPASTTGATPFPTFTVGGSAGFEVPL